VALPDEIAERLMHGPDLAPGDPTNQLAPAELAPGVATDARRPADGPPSDTTRGGAHGQE